MKCNIIKQNEIILPSVGPSVHHILSAGTRRPETSHTQRNQRRGAGQATCASIVLARECARSASLLTSPASQEMEMNLPEM